MAYGACLRGRYGKKSGEKPNGCAPKRLVPGQRAWMESFGKSAGQLYRLGLRRKLRRTLGISTKFATKFATKLLPRTTGKVRANCRDRWPMLKRAAPPSC